MMNDPKVLTGVVAMVALVILFLLVISSGERKSARTKRNQVETPVAPEKTQTPTLTAEALVHDLLSDKKWRSLSFDTLSQHIGGFRENDLRQLLVRAGAIRFLTRQGEEHWGLLDRNRRHVGHTADNRADATDDLVTPTTAGRVQNAKSLVQKITSAAGKLKPSDPPETPVLSDAKPEPSLSPKPTPVTPAQDDIATIGVSDKVGTPEADNEKDKAPDAEKPKSTQTS